MREKINNMLELLFAFFIWVFWHTAIWAIAIALLVVVAIGFPFFLIAEKNRKKKEEQDKLEAKNKFEEWVRLPR